MPAHVSGAARSLHWLPVVAKSPSRRREGARVLNSPLGMALGGSLIVSVALLAVMFSLILQRDAGAALLARARAPLPPRTPRRPAAPRLASS